MKAVRLLYRVAPLCMVIVLSGPLSVSATDTQQEAAVVKEAAEAAGAMEAININSASVEALSKIPGVGPKIGEAIAAYRETHGAFNSVADLVNVEGIDASLLEKIKPFISI